MAINDGLRPNRNRLTDAREGMGMLPVIIGVLAALALGWYFFGDRLMPNNTTRTSTPVTGSPTSGPTNTNPSNPTKQP